MTELAAPVPRPRLPPFLVAWAWFVAGCVVLVGAKAGLDHWYDAEWAIWQQYVDRAMDDRTRLKASLFGNELFDIPTLPGRLPTFDEVRSHFDLSSAERQPLVTGEEAFVMPGRTVCADVSDGWVVTLVFQDGKLQRIGLKPPPAPQTPPSPAWRWWSRRAGPALALAGFLVWLGALLSLVSEPRRVNTYTQVALAGALACLIGWTVLGRWDGALGHPGTMAGVYASAAMFFAAFGAPSGLFRRAPCVDDETRCAKCGYNLSGNVSGVCPECGTETRKHARLAREERLAAAAWRVALVAQADNGVHANED